MYDTTLSEEIFSKETTVTDDRIGAYDRLYKIIIIGESGVGKTNLLGRWMDDKFTILGPTVSIELTSRSFRVQGQVIKFQLWDTAGQEVFRSLTASYYRQAHGAILVYDITRSSTFLTLNSWLKDIKNAPGNENCQILVIGNKSDLENEREVSMEKGVEFARDNGLNFMETSAMSGNNVDRAFQVLMRDIHKLAQRYAKLEFGRKISNVKPRNTVVLTGEDNQQQKDDGCVCESIW